MFYKVFSTDIHAVHPYVRTLYIRRAVNVVGCILVSVTHVRYASVEPHLIEAGRQAVMSLADREYMKN